MIDFKNLDEILDQNIYQEIKQYIEFQNPCNIRFLVDPKQIPENIWKLFRQAQKEHIEKTGKSNDFDFNNDIDYIIRENDIFPIPIQGMGALENHAVDRASCDEKGKYRFAYDQKFRHYTSPGGGMVLISDLKNMSQEKQKEAIENKKLVEKNKKIEQVLDEHLEEEHGNLWQKATADYDKMSAEEFKKSLNDVLKIEQFKELSDLKDALEKKIETATGSHAEILAALVRYMDEEIKQSKNPVPLHVIRAQLQIMPFKQSPIYKEAIQYITDHSEDFDLEQYLDIRTLGKTTQTSHTFLMHGEPLETWFEKKFNGQKGQFADDLIHSRAKYLTTLELLARSRDVRFSHIVIPTLHTEYALYKHLQFKDVFNANEYELARFMLTVDEALANAFRNHLKFIDELPDSKRQLKEKLLELAYVLVEHKNDKTPCFSDQVIVEVLENTKKLVEGGMKHVSYCEYIEKINTFAPAHTIHRTSILKVVGLMTAICAIAVTLGLVVAPSVGIAAGVALGGLGFFYRGSLCTTTEHLRAIIYSPDLEEATNSLANETINPS